MANALPDYVDERQRGFIKGRLGVDHIMDIEVWAFGLAMQGSAARATMILLDMEAAFPSLSHSFLGKCLRRFGADHPVISVILDLCTGAATTLLVSGKEFDGFPIACGVRQGCPLSGSIFVLCFNTLLCEIDIQMSAASLKMTIELRLYAYATTSRS